MKKISTLSFIAFAFIIALTILAPVRGYSQQPDDREDALRKRVALNPEEPGVYRDYGDFMVENRRWDHAVGAYEKCLFALLSPEIIRAHNRIDQLNQDESSLKKLTSYIDTVKRHKHLKVADKKRLLAEAQKCLAGFVPLDGMVSERIALTALVKKKTTEAEERIPGLDEVYRELVKRTPLESREYLALHRHWLRLFNELN